uniref:Secreted protein n=1 Tax=Cacopsylla melanoneura TaxID=428564 RepID=A0A8D8XD19_9HEMI
MSTSFIDGHWIRIGRSLRTASVLLFCTWNTVDTATLNRSDSSRIPSLEPMYLRNICNIFSGLTGSLPWVVHSSLELPWTTRRFNSISAEDRVILNLNRLK